MTIDGNVVKDSNIADLINDAMHERKITKAASRVQFARLLRVLNIPSVLVGNKELLTTTDFSFSNIKKLGQPPASSTPIITRGRASRVSKKRKGVEKRKIREHEEKERLFAVSNSLHSRHPYNFHEKRRFAACEKKTSIRLEYGN